MVTYLYAVTEEMIAALMTCGARPKVEEGDESEVLRFDGTDLYYSIDFDSVSLDERMEVGGNVMISYWSFATSGGANRADFAAQVVRDSWHLFSQRT